MVFFCLQAAQTADVEALLRHCAAVLTWQDAMWMADEADEMRGRCVDALPNCGELAGSNLSACGEFPELLLSECAATCGTCSYRTLVAEQMSCDDTHAECANWAKAGECGRRGTLAEPWSTLRERSIFSGRLKACLLFLPSIAMTTTTKTVAKTTVAKTTKTTITKVPELL